MNPSFVPCALDDAALDELDRNGWLVDAENAGGLAWSRADAPRELREIVGGVQAPNGCFPPAVVRQVVPIGDQVVDRAAGVAEGHAAVHAAGSLLALLLLGERFVDLEPILDAFFDLAPCGLFALNLKEAGILTHAAPLS